jgi:UDP-glucose 4-epimerase
MSAITSKRVLVTGGSGFIGANLVRRLRADGHEVHLILRPTASDWRLRDIRASVAIHVVDMGDATAMTKALEQLKPQWVFHLAAHGGYSFQSDVAEMVRTNYVCTANLVSAAVQVGIEILVNVGSSSEYGFKDHAPTEDEPTTPNSYYAVTKAAATEFCCYAAKAHGIPIPTVRLYSVYGPFEDPRRLLPTLIVHALEKRWPQLVAPDTCRDFVYVDDVIAALLLLAANPPRDLGAIYNLGSGRPTSIGELVAAAAKLFGVEETPDWNSLPPREWDTNVWISNPTKAELALGWMAQTNLRDGMAAFSTWLQADPARLKYYRHHIFTAAKG